MPLLADLKTELIDLGVKIAEGEAVEAGAKAGAKAALNSLEKASGELAMQGLKAEYTGQYAKVVGSELSILEAEKALGYFESGVVTPEARQAFAAFTAKIDEGKAAGLGPLRAVQGALKDALKGLPGGVEKLGLKVNEIDAARAAYYDTAAARDKAWRAADAAPSFGNAKKIASESPEVKLLTAKADSAWGRYQRALEKAKLPVPAKPEFPPFPTAAGPWGQQIPFSPSTGRTLPRYVSQILRLEAPAEVGILEPRDLVKEQAYRLADEAFEDLQIAESRSYLTEAERRIAIDAAETKLGQAVRLEQTFVPAPTPSSVGGSGAMAPFPTAAEPELVRLPNGEFVSYEEAMSLERAERESFRTEFMTGGEVPTFRQLPTETPPFPTAPEPGVPLTAFPPRVLGGLPPELPTVLRFGPTVEEAIRGTAYQLNSQMLALETADVAAPGGARALALRARVNELTEELAGLLYVHPEFQSEVDAIIGKTTEGLRRTGIPFGMEREEFASFEEYEASLPQPAAPAPAPPAPTPGQAVLRANQDTAIRAAFEDLDAADAAMQADPLSRAARAQRAAAADRLDALRVAYPSRYLPILKPRLVAAGLVSWAAQVKEAKWVVGGALVGAATVVGAIAALSRKHTPGNVSR